MQPVNLNIADNNKLLTEEWDGSLEPFIENGHSNHSNKFFSWLKGFAINLRKNPKFTL